MEEWAERSKIFRSVQKLSDHIHSIGSHHLGTKDPVRIFGELVLDSIAPFALGLIDSPRIIDLGSGVGLPSIPLVAIVPGLRAILIDERASRLDTAAEWAKRAGISDRIEIRKGRIERILPDVSRETDLLVSKGLGGKERLAGIIGSQARFRSALIFSGDSSEEGHPYRVAGKRRRILLVPRSAFLSTFESL